MPSRHPAAPILIRQGIFDRATTFALHLDSHNLSGSGDLFSGPILKDREWSLLDAALLLGEPVFIMRTDSIFLPELGADPTSGRVAAAGFPEYITLEDLKEIGSFPDGLVFAITSTEIYEEPEDEDDRPIVEVQGHPRRSRRRNRRN